MPIIKFSSTDRLTIYHPTYWPHYPTFKLSISDRSRPSAVRLVGPLPASERAAKRARRSWPKRPLFSGFVSVCLSVHALQAKRRNAAHRNSARLSLSGLATGAPRKIPGSISRFPGNGKCHFLSRQCLSWAPFSSEWKSKSKKADQDLVGKNISFQTSPFAARYPEKWRRRYIFPGNP